MKIFKQSISIFIFLFLILSSLLSFSFAEAGNYPLTIIDDTETAVTIPQEPQRIISTAPSNTEILFDLGLQEKIVGITLSLIHI